jgi:ATP-binding cassette subfamily B multidrug efflux pump
MWRLRGYLKPYWKVILLGPLFLILEVYMDLLQPKLMASIVNEGIMNRDLAHIQHTGLIMVGCALIGLTGGILCTIFASIASQSFGADVRKGLFEKVQGFSFRNLDQFKSGTLITRLTNDVVQLQTLLQMTLRILIRAPLLVVGSVIMAVSINGRLGIILAIVIPLMVLTLYLLIRYAFPVFTIVQRKLDGVNTVLQENLTGIRVVKAFVRSDFEEKRFGEANSDYTDIVVRASRVVSINLPVMTLLMNIGIVAILWFGGDFVRNQSLRVGDLVAFINYVMQVMISLTLVGNALVFVSRAKVSADRVHEVMSANSDITDKPDAKSDELHFGKVEFEGVSFQYGESQRDLVLKNISFTAEAGRTIAILGATGSGKSSLVNLIPRLYDVTEGSIKIDGIDVRDMPLYQLRGQVAMVLQEAILFTGTIFDNIRFGNPEATQAEVDAVAIASQAHEFISKFPQGYETIVGQRGVNLSGGQKQRISIARALLMKPKVLILDDSTSAVDLGTESRIQKALREMMESCTCILIAQRISSVMDADHIIVLDEGRIVAEGTHATLMQQSLVYQEIYRSQLGNENVASR